MFQRSNNCRSRRSAVVDAPFLTPITTSPANISPATTTTTTATALSSQSDTILAKAALAQQQQQQQHHHATALQFAAQQLTSASPSSIQQSMQPSCVIASLHDNVVCANSSSTTSIDSLGSRSVLSSSDLAGAFSALHSTQSTKSFRDLNTMLTSSSQDAGDADDADDDDGDDADDDSVLDLTSRHKEEPPKNIKNIMHNRAATIDDTYIATHKKQSTNFQPPFESIRTRIKPNSLPDAQLIQRHIDNLISQNEAIMDNWNLVSIRSCKSDHSSSALSSWAPSSASSSNSRDNIKQTHSSAIETGASITTTNITNKLKEQHIHQTTNDHSFQNNYARIDKQQQQQQQPIQMRSKSVSSYSGAGISGVVSNNNLTDLNNKHISSLIGSPKRQLSGDEEAAALALANAYSAASQLQPGFNSFLKHKHDLASPAHSGGHYGPQTDISNKPLDPNAQVATDLSILKQQLLTNAPSTAATSTSSTTTTTSPSSTARLESLPFKKRKISAPNMRY